MSFSTVCKFYEYAADLSPLNSYLTYSFAGCTADTTFYLGFEPLVNYLNQIKVLAGQTHSDANILFGAEANNYVPPVVTPVVNNNITPTPAPAPKATSKKKISTLKLKKYKKGTKKITGKTIKKAKVVIRSDKKKYTIKADKKGNFKVTLKKKLKKKDTIKVTVSKSGYKSKTKTFKVK